MSGRAQFMDLDLNLPAEDDDIGEPFHIELEAMPTRQETVDESPDPVQSGAAHSDDEVSEMGEQHNAAPQRASNGSVPTTTVPTESTSHHEMADAEGVSVGGHKEVASSPQQPFLGMRFDTLSDAREHYNAYARRMGFSMKSNTSKKAARTNEKEKQSFVCNKHRAPKTEEEKQKDMLNDLNQVSPVRLESEDDDGGEAGPSKKPSGSKSCAKRKRETIKQTKCPAKMIVKLINNKWQVIYFISEHNHPLNQKPSLAKYLRSHRGIPPEERDFLKILHECNLETGRMMSVMSSFYGDEGFVPYEPKDITNLRTKFRAENQEFDIDETIAYFMELQENDPGFFYKIKKDEENRVEHIFWVDSAARKEYVEAYHDCVSFDTTFCTNTFNMPFAPFIGINRHGQSIMLGCGFLRDESEYSFKWLFEAFLEAMAGKQPDNIITDQDKAMANAIAAIFPLSVHRNCRWHIIKKANEKLGPYLGRHPGLAEDFNEVIDESMSVEEFEARWTEMVQKWDLFRHETFAWLKKYAHQWVPCYFRNRFFPFMQSTQRSEGFNSVLKRYVNPQNSIKHFVKQYEKIQKRVLCKQNKNDFRTDELELETWSPFPIEKHAMAVYTRPIYIRFKMEFQLIGRYNVQPQGRDMYLVVPNNLRCYPYGGRSYMVNCCGGNNNYSCECCKFERDGLLCCHALKVLTHVGVDTIPQRYILRRWTQEAVESVFLPQDLEGKDVMPEESREQIRFANLSIDFVSMAKLGCKSDQAEAIARRHIREMKTEFAQLNKVKRKRSNNSQNGPSRTTTGPVPSSQPSGSRANQTANSVPDVQRTASAGKTTATPHPSGSKANQTTSAGKTAAAPQPPGSRANQPTKSVSNMQRTTSAGKTAGAQHPSGTKPNQKCTPIPNMQQTASAALMPPHQQKPPAPVKSHSFVNVQQTVPSHDADPAATSSTPTMQSSSHAMNTPPPHTMISTSRNGVPTASNVEPWVVLNPPRSNTKGRKKGRYLAGIELQAKKTNLCGTCGQPGHNSATCTAALNNER